MTDNVWTIVLVLRKDDVDQNENEVYSKTVSDTYATQMENTLDLIMAGYAKTLEVGSSLTSWLQRFLERWIT